MFLQTKWENKLTWIKEKMWKKTTKIETYIYIYIKDVTRACLEPAQAPRGHCNGPGRLEMRFNDA